MVKLTKGQLATLVAASLPMIATGLAGAVATFVNMRSVLPSDATALGMVAAGEGATLVAAIVALAVTLLGQTVPSLIRTGMWLLPALASVLGFYLAPSHAMAAVMAATPMAMTVAGEGLTFVARRIVVYRTGLDVNADERQRRLGGLLLWHAQRARNGKWIGKRVSQAAVWRLSKQFASTDATMALQLADVQRNGISTGAAENLAHALGINRPEAPRAALSAPLTVSPAPEVAEAPVAPQIAAQSLTAASRPALPSAASLLGADDTLKVAEAAGVAPVAGTAAALLADPDEFVMVKAAAAEAEATVKADPSVKLLSTAEVATLKGVAPGTVRSWKHRGKLPFTMVDGAPMYHPADVAKLD
ncbi:helix-turn-helix DNA-binding protein [Streptomyces phage Mischief19]|nr:helix-turn-helix DNA-binding protein [Streptomyces phage Mischief19]